VTFELVPNFRALGPKLGKDMPLVKLALAQADGGQLHAQLERDGYIELAMPSGPVRLGPEEIQVRLQAKPDYAAAASHGQVVVLDVRISDALRHEGFAREAINRMQRARKSMDLAYEARIRVLYAASGDLALAIAAHAALIAGETLALELTPIEAAAGQGEKHEVDIDGAPLVFWVSVVEG
jgi:isoleucyl-tRNA synthetase